jgi:DNA polymerase-3 subunit epsilon
MKVHTDHPEYKTARQWAKLGKLPKRNARKLRMWANHWCVTAHDFYAPDDVEPADPERLKKFFAKERERLNTQARERYNKSKERGNQWAAHREIAQHIEELTAAYTAAPELARVFVLDTETTGLDPQKDEILQLSIIDGAGAEVYNSYCRPGAESWNEAQRVNHISPADVQNAPRLSSELPKICAILARATMLIGYNLNFDLDFLCENGVIVPKHARHIDVMHEFAPIYGEYSDEYDGYKWKKLTTAAEYYGYDWSSHGKAHNALADCYATLWVYNHIQAQDPNEKE